MTKTGQPKTRDIRVEKVPLNHLLAFKAKAAKEDMTVAALIRQMIAEAAAQE